MGDSYCKMKISQDTRRLIKKIFKAHNNGRKGNDNESKSFNVRTRFRGIRNYSYRQTFSQTQFKMKRKS